jgi:FkbM family methyltransferase
VPQRLRSQRHLARRIAQTPTTFTNWAPVLFAMGREAIGRGPAELEFKTRAGVSIQCPNQPGARVPVYEIFAEDCYSLDWILGGLKQRPIQVVDIGGQVGVFSSRLATLHPGAKIMTFEPSATSAGYIRRNLAANGIANRVEVIEAAVAGTTGTATFADNLGGSGLNRLVSTGEPRQQATLREVATISFDDIVAKAPAPVDFVKIDCEGGEYDLVLNSTPSSWASVQRVVLEFHAVSGYSWAQLRDWLADAGLAVQAVEEHGGYGCAWLSRTALPPRPA